MVTCALHKPFFRNMNTNHHIRRGRGSRGVTRLFALGSQPSPGSVEPEPFTVTLTTVADLHVRERDPLKPSPARFRRGIRARASDRLRLYLQLRCTCFGLSSSEDQILEQTQRCCPRECSGRTGMCSVDWAPEMRAGVMRACMCHWISFSEFK